MWNFLWNLWKRILIESIHVEHDESINVEHVIGWVTRKQNALSSYEFCVCVDLASHVR